MFLFPLVQLSLSFLIILLYVQTVWEIFPNLHFFQKLDISDLVAKRMDAQRRLQTDPNDIEALLVLQEIQMKMQNWCQSNVKPGQFTGELVKNLLPKEDLQGGFQAWAKKVDFFVCACILDLFETPNISNLC